MKKFGILGSGTWGTALANMLVNMGKEVKVWSPNQQEIDNLNLTHKHPHLPTCDLNPKIIFSSDLKYVCEEVDCVIFATPSVFIRTTAEKVKNLLTKDQILITVAKGVEPETLYTMSEIITDVLGNEYKVVSLSGPTHAEEVAVGLPTLIVAACEDEDIAIKVRDSISNDILRVYSNTDIKGAEIAGALKNIIALAGGMCDGLGFGDNAKAALITRGLNEITKLGTTMGCKAETFYGLTGIGDIVVTATSKHSRNHNAGVLLAQGYNLEQTLEKIGMVVEGINALVAAQQLSEKYNIELPIVNAVYAVVYKGAKPTDVVNKLFLRKTKSE